MPLVRLRAALQYMGKAGFEAHQAAPHFKEWEKFASSDPFSAPPEVFFFYEQLPVVPVASPAVADAEMTPTQSAALSPS